MSPKFQKRSALKFVGRIIPHAKSCGTISLVELMTLAKNEPAKFEAQVELSCMQSIQWYPIAKGYWELIP
jgi:hypothetical protein